MNRATARRTLPLLAQPAFVIIVIVATVHIIRAKPAEAIVTYAVAAALVIEQAVLRRRVDKRPVAGATLRGSQRPLVETVAVLAGAVALGWPASGWELYDWQVKIVTAVPGVVVALLVFTRRPPEADAVHARPGRHGWLWAAVGVAVCLQELVSFVQQPNPQDGSYEHPTISFLIEPALMASPPARGCLLTAWLVAGCFLLRRAGLLGRPRRAATTSRSPSTSGSLQCSSCSSWWLGSPGSGYPRWAMF